MIELFNYAFTSTMVGESLVVNVCFFKGKGEENKGRERGKVPYPCWTN